MKIKNIMEIINGLEQVKECLLNKSKCNDPYENSLAVGKLHEAMRLIATLLEKKI